jgi:hypothetical protein
LGDGDEFRNRLIDWPLGCRGARLEPFASGRNRGDGG